MGKSWTVENSWTCASCGSATQKGRHTTCQACGATKGKDVVDRIPDPDSAPHVTDKDMLRDAAAGANWVCEYCGKQERNNRGDCTYCAAMRGDDSEVIKRTQSAEGTLVSKIAEQVALDIDREIVKDLFTPVRWYLRRSVQIKVAIAAAVIGFLVWLGLFLFLPHEVNTAVTSTTWERTMQLQQRETRHKSSWDDQRPDSHFNDECRTKQRGTEDCNPHDCNAHTESYNCNPHDCNCRNVCTDNGNGYSTCNQECSTCYDSCDKTVYDTCYDQCPVYDQWCEYDYYAWPTILEKTTSGSDHNVRWPDMPTPKKLQRIKSKEKYKVVFSGEDDSWDIAPGNVEEFKIYKQGARWKIKVNRAGKVEPLKELKAESE
jgi:ribosomal protein L32